MVFCKVLWENNLPEATIKLLPVLFIQTHMHQQPFISFYPAPCLIFQHLKERQIA
jgi:hypothetical protein